MRKLFKFLWDLYWALNPKAKEARRKAREGDTTKEGGR